MSHFFKKRANANSLLAFPSIVIAFPVSFVFIIILLISFDLVSKWIVTSYFEINLSYEQRLLYANDSDDSDLKAGHEQLSLFGQAGKILRLKLYFNDRFAFSKGARLHETGHYYAFISLILILLLYWKTTTWDLSRMQKIAWSLILAGSFANTIDRSFVVFFHDRSWVLSLHSIEGSVSGVVDFIDMIWFDWRIFHNIPILEMLAYKRWPIYNFADFYLFTGFLLLILSYRKLFFPCW